MLGGSVQKLLYCDSGKFIDIAENEGNLIFFPFDIIITTVWRCV